MFQPVLKRTAAALCAVGLLLSYAVPPAQANERGWHEHEFREHEFHDDRFIDHRFHHDHYYPPRGFVFAALPPHFSVVFHGGIRLYFADGVWYRADGPARYVVIMPPAGVFVAALPPYYTTVWANGVAYYYANGVYYVATPEGYLVTNPPPGNVVVAPPAAVPPASAMPPASAAAPLAAGAMAQSPAGQLFVYPRQGQSAQQQTSDRNACNEWATGQTGYDPVHSAGAMSADLLAQKQADYNRALGACLDGRGYTVK